MNPRRIPLAWALAGLAGCGLGPEKQARGGGLEGETLTLTGIAVYADGTPAASAQVRLRGSDAVDSSSISQDLIATTDAQGRYSVTGVRAGDYYVITESPSEQASFQEVHVAPAESTAAVISVPTDTIKTKGVIRVRVVPPTAGAPLPPGLLQVVGLGWEIPIDSTGVAVSRDVPPGSYFIRVAYPALGMMHRLNGGVVKAGDTLELGPYAFNDPKAEDLSAWKDSVPVRLNTTAAGAGLTENVAGFPLLLRLDSASLPFEKLLQRHDGGDLRFTDAKGKRLPFEIEMWDGPGRKAVVWVRLDTVYADRADQTIYARFGKADVFAAASPSATFDTADGARGAWHFAQFNPGGLLSDATANANQLQMGTIRKETGVTFQAWTLRPGDELGAAAHKSQEPASLTLAGWFKPNGATALGRLVWKHRRGEALPAYGVNWYGLERVLEFCLADAKAAGGVVLVRASVPVSQDWTFFAAAFDAKTGTATLYVDGQIGRAHV